MAELPVPFGKYELLAELGRGGFAVVYRARDTTLDREVALKLLHPGYAVEAAVVQRFQREARQAARLRHANIVRVYEVDTVNGQPYIAMEYLPGGTLAARLTGAPWPWAAAAPVLAQVAAALEYAHRKQLLHRDVKPANILFDEDGHAVLVDFGLVKSLTASGLTTEGTRLGTPAYMAPEQVDDRLGALGPPADVYALGVVAYELLTGRVPFMAETPVAVLHAQVYEPPPNPQALNPALPEVVAAVLLQALTKTPAERYPSAPALVQALGAAFEAQERARAQAALAAQGRAEVDRAVAAGDWSAAQIAVERWLAALPGDSAAQALRAEIERRLAVPPPPPVVPPDPLIKPYRHLQRLIAAQRWAEAQRQAQAILAREPDYRDVPQLAEQAAQALHAVPVPPPPGHPAGAPPRRIPAWMWGLGGLVLVGLVVFLLIRYGGGGAPPTAVPSPTWTPEPPTPTWTPEPPTPTWMPEPTPTWTPRPTFTPTPPPPLLGDTLTRTTDGMVMVYVPAGEFAMGRTGGESYEQPVHTVALTDFWIDRTEVTNGQYQRCATEGPCSQSYYKDDIRYNGLTQPVVGVDWEQARVYCEWAGGQLPTEAQWEYAARGSEGRLYPWGDDWRTGVANCAEADCKDGFEYTAPVGSFAAGASWVGAWDLAGNVWEWTADWYGAYPAELQMNPTGPATGEYKVVRGGSWDYEASWLPCAYRIWLRPALRFATRGFRCVLARPGD